MTVLDSPSSSGPLDRFRLDREIRLRSELHEQYGRRIDRFHRQVSEIDEFRDSETPPGERQFFLAEGVRLTPALAPVLYDLARRALRNLCINQNIEFYIYRTDFPDAFCSYDKELGLFSVCISPEYVNMLEEVEMLDLLGHEIGHAVLDHVHNRFLLTEDLYLDVDDWEQDLSRRVINRAETRKLEKARRALELLDPGYLARCRRLARLQELSADRIGLLCSRDLGASLTSHMKELTGGLSSKFIRYDAAGLVRQLDEIDALDLESRDLFDGTHPITAVRMKSLMVFAQSEKYAKFVGDDAWVYPGEEADQMVVDLLRASERFPSRPSDRKMIEALSRGALWLHAPAQLDDRLCEALEGGLYVLLEYSEIPREWMPARGDDLAERLREACRQLTESMSPEERERVLRLAVELALELGPAPPSVRARSEQMCDWLGLPRLKAHACLHELRRTVPSHQKGQSGRRHRRRHPLRPHVFTGR